MTSLSDAYTLVIPTYNRAARLARLLDYLEREKADFPIVVLDSSEAPAREQNGERVARSHLAVRRVTYPSDLHPFLKVRDGAKQVGSPYCSICADDDIVLLPGLRACVALLDGRREAVAAHGLYFNFDDTRFFDLSEVVYRGPSVAAADPLRRLRTLFGHYEAPFYAVYRTRVLAKVFERVEEMHTTLGRELLTAALTAVAGEILRATDFYYGRRTAGSFSYDAWHPWQFFTASPQALFDEYRVLRDIVAAAVAPDALDEARDRMRTVIDLVFLGYLEPLLRSDVLQLIFADRIAGRDSMSTAAHVWKTFVRRRPRVSLRVSLAGPGRIARALARLAAGAIPMDYVVARRAGGSRRTYRIFEEFLSSKGLGEPVGRGSVLAMLERLDAY
jgi:glycosyltransferase domain-containing protein